ncbi:MAG: formylglycine-generating enzyme family protein [Acidobacteriota bacterium]|jgi:formylglycine-generating enzyme required for sulfatase activity|nr:formylglycine-generating enzyme family protein [Acidobacteriota bacterium]
MVKRGLLAMLALSILCCLVACGKKGADETAGTDATTDASAVSEVVPGEMVFIPAGEFIMGSNVKDKDDKYTNAYPEHKMNLPAYWIDKYEVTNLEFLQFSVDKDYAGEGALQDKNWRLFHTVGMNDNVPVVYITWKDAETYCKANGKRLPTEPEWEKAARGAEGLRYPWGNEWEDGRALTNEAGSTAVDIGRYDDVSPYGVHDMLGNVQEWTASIYGPYKGGKADSGADRQWRVVRGLSRNHRAKQGGLWNRDAREPSALLDYGFRCAKDATPEDIAKNTK